MSEAVVDPLEFLEGLPQESSITDGEVRRMYELGMGLPEGSRYVELGVWQGRSAVLLAWIAQQRQGQFYGIDDFAHPGSSFEVVEKRLREWGVLQRATLLVGKTAEVGFDLGINFLHVDADHTSPGIDRDCAKYLPLVRVGGVVAFDDYVQLDSEARYPDVKRVADRWCGDAEWENLGTVEGMGFFRRRGKR